MAAKVYHVDYERDPDGRWVASVREVAGCHTQGRTLAQTRERIREALSLYDDDTDRAELRDQVKLPGPAQRLLAAYAATKQQAEASAAAAAAAAREAVRAIDVLQVSRRDAGELLGLSHQRVQQLVDDADRQRRTVKATRRLGQKVAAKRESALRRLVRPVAAHAHKR